MVGNILRHLPVTITLSLISQHFGEREVSILNGSQANVQGSVGTRPGPHTPQLTEHALMKLSYLTHRQDD